MTVLNTTRMTARQFLLMDQDPPGVRLELINGEIGMAPSPSFNHSNADSVLRYFLMHHIRQHDLGKLVGDVDTVFDEFNVRRPDLLFIAKARLHLRTGRVVNIMPDLCIEILSPQSIAIDTVDKFQLYAAHGIPHYWIVSPEDRFLTAYSLVGQTYQQVLAAQDAEIISPPPFPNLNLPLGDLWL